MTARDDDKRSKSPPNWSHTRREEGRKPQGAVPRYVRSEKAPTSRESPSAFDRRRPGSDGKPDRSTTRSSREPQTIQLAGLQLSTELGSGGQAKVFELSGEPDFVVKKYLKNIPVNDPVLRDLVAWPTSLAEIERTLIAERTSWPLSLISTGDRNVGVLIPRAPAAFYLSNGRLAELGYLILADRAEPLGINIPDAATRLRVLRALADTLRVLHADGMSHGDISMRNVLWAASPPHIYLLDCDGARLANAGAALPYVVTPHWEDPRLTRGEIAAPDVQSDCRSFALAFYRAYFTARGHQLAVGSISSIPRTPYLSDTLKRLVVDGLGDAPRPSMERWVPAIDALLAAGRELGETAAVTSTVAATRCGSGPPQTHAARPPKPKSSIASPGARRAPAKPRPSPSTIPQPPKRGSTVLLILVLVLLVLSAAVITYAILN